ncbi:MAG: glycosyltransferase, partial [Clostridia bacterium]|nr:glycosyltransferase [Clostridia bacterium]
MKLAFLILSMDCGGSERAAAMLCNYFVQHSHDVTLFVLTGKSSFYHLDKRVNAVFLNTQVSGSKAKRLSGIIKRAAKLRRAVRRERPDVLVGMSCFMSVYTLFCTAFLRTKSVGTERANPYEYKNTLANRILRKTASVLCNGFVCQTIAARDFFPRISHKKIAVIQNAVTLPENIEICTVPEKTIPTMGRLIK